MPLVARKQEGETWREAVARIAGKQGLATECLEVYDDLMAKDLAHTEADAAKQALYEWDCLAYEPESGEKPMKLLAPTPMKGDPF